MKAIAVGGGIGGLSLALSLHQIGVEVRVYEAVRDLVPLGVGINLQPAAVRELTELDLGNELANIGIATQALSCFNKFGQLIWSEPRGVAAGYKWPQYSIHRGQLQFVLLRALRERADEQTFRNGLRLVSFTQGTDEVTAIFRDDGTGTTVVDRADILIGADGIHSTVRHQLYPDEGEPRFAGQILWRAAVDAEPFLGGRTMAIAGHFDQRIVVYPIAPSAQPGHVLTNWICQMTVPDTAMAREDWNQRVSQERVLAAFDQWRFPWLDMPALIRRTPDIYEFPLVDRDPVRAWTFGRVTLLGDAAHPMHPSGSQAGSQAVIDARALAGALLKEPSASAALKRYEGERRPVLNDITLRNRRLGPEAALQLAEERAPNGFERIEDVIAPEEIKSIADSFFAAAGLDVESVNSRPPYVPANIRRQTHPE
jgi:2-polyprenyl-6-methoxyphenol hydroxylase-like FAD-dependent oxidoreductase